MIPETRLLNSHLTFIGFLPLSFVFVFSSIVKLFDYLWILFTFRITILRLMGSVTWRRNDSDFCSAYHFCLESAGPILNHLFHCQSPKDLYFSTHDPQISHYGLIGQRTIRVLPYVIRIR